LEGIKTLYGKLHTASKEDRERIWKKIMEKNRILFNKRIEELNKLFRRK